MNVVLEAKDGRAFIKAYPCVLEHLGAADGLGSANWLGVVVIAKSAHEGMVIGVPKGSNATTKVGHIMLTGSFDANHWGEYRGRVVISNDPIEPSTERRLDPNL